MTEVFIIHNTISYDIGESQSFPYIKSLQWIPKLSRFEVDKQYIYSLEFTVIVYSKDNNFIKNPDFILLKQIAAFLSDRTIGRCKISLPSTEDTTEFIFDALFHELQFDSINILGKLVPNHPLLRIVNVVDTHILDHVIGDKDPKEKGVCITAFDVTDSEDKGYFYQVKYIVDMTESTSRHNILFKNFASIQTNLFTKFNAFIRDYVYFENSSESISLLRNDLSIIYPLSKVLDPIFSNYSGVDKDGTLTLTSVLRDYRPARNSLGHYKNQENSYESPEYTYFSSCKPISTKCINIVNVGLHCMRFDDQLYGNPNTSFPFFNIDKNNVKTNIAGESFQFIVLSSSLTDVIHMYMSGSTFTDNYKEIDNFNDVQNDLLNYKSAKSNFSKSTGLLDNYFRYICYRLIPFVFDDDSNNDNEQDSESCNRYKFKLYISRSNNLKNRSQYNVMKHITELCNTSPTSVLFYNDVDKFFFDRQNFPNYKSIPFNCYCCGNYDDLLYNFGLVKERLLPYISYSYQRLFENHRDFIEISREISSYCCTNMREIMLGNKNLWHLRAMESAFLKGGYAKPNRTRMDTSKYSYDNETKFLTSPNCETHFMQGGHVGEASVGWHSIIKYRKDITRNEDDTVYFLDFDAQYASVICEFEIGYLCHEGFFKKSKKESWSDPNNADIESDLSVTGEPYETFVKYLKIRRDIKKTEGKKSYFYIALKLLQNSMCGCIQAEKSAIRSKYFGNSITGRARNCLIDANEMASKFGLHVVCSQTDSLGIVNVIHNNTEENESVVDWNKQHSLKSRINCFIDAVNHIHTYGFTSLVIEEEYDAIFIANKMTYLGIRNISELNKVISSEINTLQSILCNSNIYNDYNIDSNDGLLLFGTDFKFVPNSINIFKKTFYSHFKVCGFVNCNWSILDNLFFFYYVYNIVKFQQLECWIDKDIDKFTTIREDVTTKIHSHLFSSISLSNRLNGSPFLFSLKRTPKRITNKSDEIKCHVNILDNPAYYLSKNELDSSENNALEKSDYSEEVRVLEKLRNNFITKSALLHKNVKFVPQNSSPLHNTVIDIKVLIESPLQLAQLLNIKDLEFIMESIQVNKNSNDTSLITLQTRTKKNGYIIATITKSAFIYELSEQTLNYFELLAPLRNETLHENLKILSKNINSYENNLYYDQLNNNTQKNRDKEQSNWKLKIVAFLKSKFNKS